MIHMYIWQMDGSGHWTIRKGKKGCHVQIVHTKYNIEGLDDAGIRKIIKDWMKEEK